jgi:hypothetical protein
MIIANQVILNERRENRTDSLFHVFVRMIGSDGQRIKLNTISDNICSGGLFMRLPHLLEHDTQLFTFILVPNNVGLATIGRVVRTEEKEYGLCGTAIRFIHSRLLPLNAA